MSNPFVQIGVVTGYEYTQNREGEQTVAMLQVSLSEEEDVQSVELYQPVGRNGPPTIDSAVLVLTIAEGFKIAIGINDGLDVTELAEGEILAYSQDEDGVHRTEILQKADGDIEIKSIDNDELACATQTFQNSGVVDIQNENGSINMAANGIVSIGNGNSFVCIESLVASIFSTIATSLNAWVASHGTPSQPILASDLTSLFSGIATNLQQSIASANLKAD